MKENIKPNKKIQIQFISSDHKILDSTVKQICNFLKEINIDILGTYTTA